MKNLAWTLGLLVAAGCGGPVTAKSGAPACPPGVGCALGTMCAWDNHCYPPGLAPPNPHAPDLAVATSDLMSCAQAGCQQPTPICDPDTGQCVQCTTDTNCPDGTICRAKACVPGCSQSRGCGDAGSCDVDAGRCGGCSRDADCGDPKLPRCDPGTGLCAACQPVNDNCGVSSFCQQMNGAWQCAQGCKVDADCAGLQPDGGNGGQLACCNHFCADLNSAAANCGRCGTACALGTACCAGSCTDPAKDLQNCGGCGRVCGGKNANWQCNNSACAITGCMGSWKDCNNNPADGCEADTSMDPLNCTACGKACQAPNATPGCQNGCTILACTMGFADCNKQVGDGCEVGVGGDVKNCGGCGTVCTDAPNAMAACSAGKCGIAACTRGYGDCNMLPGDGCETNLSNDANNCNGCGVQCPIPNHANSACIASACVISCLNNYKDCNNNIGDGCESNVLSDAQNCGGCGGACAGIPNATPGCAGGVCNVGVCNQGFKDCNNNPKDGCEINTGGDPNNCGACGNVCPPPPNGVAGCVNGQCGLGGCNAGYADCNNNAADGCEANLSTDKNNCSRCGNVCNIGQSCSGGVCQACGGYSFDAGGGNGCWYASGLGQSCASTCQGHGGYNAVAATHSGHPICDHFYPAKANGSNWVTVECCSTDNNTKWGANGGAPDQNFSHGACYLMCACNN